MEATQKINKFIAVYARVSTARQEEEGTIATQISAINDFAEKNGYKIVQEYRDDGWSGDIIARPGLDQLRLDAKKRIWDAVLFYDPDRLARRYSYQELVMDELRELGIEPLFVTVPPSKNSEDKLLYGVRGIFAEYERIKIAERFRFGKVRKAKEGHIILAEAPYGYDFVPKTPEKQGYIKINETEAKVVKDIFSWVAYDAMTLRAVVRHLQELGIKPRKSKRGVWNTSTLSTLLRNRTYIGEAHYGATSAIAPTRPIKKELYRKNKKTSRRIKPQDEWIIIKTPDIIDRELFEKAQNQLKDNFKLCVRNKKNEYLLAGKVWCICGERRTGEGPMHGKHLYYRCTNRVKLYPLPPTCDERGFNARDTDKLAWETTVENMVDEEKMKAHAKAFLSSQIVNTSESGINIDETKREIAKLKSREDRYARAYGDGVFSIEQYKKYSDPIKQSIALLESQLVKVKMVKEQDNKPEMPSDERIADFCRKARVALLKEDLKFGPKRRIVEDIINNVVGDQLGTLVTCGVTLDYFDYVEHQTINRNCWFAECRKINIV